MRLRNDGRNDVTILSQKFLEGCSEHTETPNIARLEYVLLTGHVGVQNHEHVLSWP